MLKNLYITFLIVLLSGNGLNAQISMLQKAMKSYQAGDVEQAAAATDSAAIHPSTSENIYTWYLRGYVYSELYKTKEKGNYHSPARIAALESYQQFFELDTISEYTKSSRSGLRYIGLSYFNDAAIILNNSPEKYDLAIKLYEKHKRIIRIIEPDHDFTSQDIEFHRMLGGIYNNIFDQDPEANKEFFNKSKNTYLYVLELDSLDYSANYHLGILYYNRAVNIIRGLDYDLDLITLELIQDECVELFRKSLPYMRKAYELNPRKKETLLGLSGIYFSLNEMEKSEEIKQELEKLEEKE